jgi:hypothetical protein
MITNKALHSEIETIEKMVASSRLADKSPTEVAYLKIGTLMLKLLLSIRTNQVLIMRKMGVQPIEPSSKRNNTAVPVDE